MTKLHLTVPVFFALALLCLGYSINPSDAQGFEPIAATDGNARALVFAIKEYAVDNDAKLPPMQSVSAFQAALTPYVASASVFSSPANGQPYAPNASVSGMSTAGFSDLSTVALFQDTAPYVDGQPTVAYLDGNVVHGGILQGDPDWLCIERAKQLYIAVSSYLQDNNQTFPPMQSQPQFQQALTPYARDSSTFLCPATNLPYTPNASLNGQTLNAIQNPHTTVLFQDSASHPDGLPTICYVDGRVAHGTLVPGPTSLQNLKHVGLALEQYIQDNNGALPPLSDYSQFENALLPYAGNTSIFTNPDTGQSYHLNASLNGDNVFSSTFPNPAQTAVVTDPALNNDGTFNTVYADGHAGTVGHWIAAGLSDGPDHNPALVWIRSGDQYNLKIDAIGSTGTLQQWGDFAPFYNSPWATSSVATVGDGSRLIVSASTLQGISPDTTLPGSGQVAMSLVGASGPISASTAGPFDGWQFYGATSFGANNHRLLWRRYDGQIALWTLASQQLAYGSGVEFTPPAGEVPIGLEAGPNGAVLLLLATPNGSADLWTIATDGSIKKQTYAPNGRRIVGLAVAPSTSLPVLLWDAGYGTAQIWRFGSSGQLTGMYSFPLRGGGTPAALALDSANTPIILRKSGSGMATIEKISYYGVVSYSKTLAPI